ncbi:MAG: hypothetical protein HYS53_01730 [Candidatus Aenigmarchaeota archaeon]|nr:hypothetical protein [Candidatus Aenigmarchaeota archaeon]
MVKKGYIHTIEMILSVLIVLFALSQFSSLYTRDTPWARNYLSLLSRDVVYTANVLGDDWQNSSFVSSSIGNILFSDAIEYEFGLRNAIKRSVFVGCFCSAAELAELARHLADFDLNERKIDFAVSDIAAVQDWNSLDVIVYGHYQNMEADKQKLLDFLKNYKGVILLSGVTQAQINSDSVLRDVFGLKWVTDSVTGSSTNGILVPDHPENASYDIKKYFYGFRSSNNTAALLSDSALNGPISCTNSTHEGLVKTRGIAKKFWIIDSSEKPEGGAYCDYVVYVDENNNNEADADEGPLIAGDNFILNGFSMVLKGVHAQTYNEKAEAETGAGWALASANGLCTGEGDDLCSDGEAVWTDTRDSEVTITINVNRPDRYEVWLRSYRGTTPKEKERVYTVSVDNGAEVLVDPFVQRDASFAGLWGWNRVENPEGFTVLLDVGTHTIDLRTPEFSEEPKWKSSAVDWIFLRNTTFNVKNNMDFSFNKTYKFVDFSETGPYPDNDRVERIAVGSENKYSGLNGPVASVIVKDGITEREAGRAVWVSANQGGEDFKNLVRAAVIWSAPKEFINVKNPSLGGSSTRAYTVFESGDLANPYQIFVTLWYSRRFD